MFYDKYVKLCNSVGKTPSAVALEIGIEKSTVTRWKSGKSQTDKNIQKVADFFGVSVEWLKSDDDSAPDKKEKPATETGDGRDEKTRILLELFSQADEQRRQEMINYAQYLLNQQNNNN